MNRSFQKMKVKSVTPDLIHASKWSSEQKIRKYLIFLCIGSFPGLSVSAIRFNAIDMHDAKNSLFIQFKGCGDSFMTIAPKIMQYNFYLLFNSPVFHRLFSFVVERTSRNSEDAMEFRVFQRHPFFCPTPSWTVSSPMICFNSRFSFSSLMRSRDDVPVTPSLSQV